MAIFKICMTLGWCDVREIIVLEQNRDAIMQKSGRAERVENPGRLRLQNVYTT